MKRFFQWFLLFAACSVLTVGGMFAFAAFSDSMEDIEDFEIMMREAPKISAYGEIPDETLAHYEGIMRAHPDRPEIYAVVSKILNMRGDYSGALRAALKGLEISPSDPRLASQAGIAAYGAGNLAAAKRHLEAAVANGPFDIGSYRALGNVLYLCGDFEAALAVVEKIPVLDPSAGESFRTAEILLAMDRYGDAVEFVNGSRVGSYEKESEIYAQMGIASLMKGDEVSAEAYFSNALEMDSDSDLTYLSRGHFYCAKKEYAKAVEFYSKYLESRPNGGAGAYRGLARAYSALGEAEKAAECLKKADGLLK